jgi:hypothetical protein
MQGTQAPDDRAGLRDSINGCDSVGKARPTRRPRPCFQAAKVIYDLWFVLYIEQTECELIYTDTPDVSSTHL